MAYDVAVEQVAAEPMMAVKAEAAFPQLAGVIRASMDKVWPVLRAGDFGKLGCNVVYYGPMTTPPVMPLMIGVRVEKPSAVGEVAPFETPAGKVAHVVYFGDYSKMKPAHEALHAEMGRQGRRLTGESWEVYGDWFDDWSMVRTDIYYLLERA